MNKFIHHEGRYNAIACRDKRKRRKKRREKKNYTILSITI